MHGSKHIFLLGLGLCLVANYVNSANIKIYGNDPKNPYADVTNKLEKQRAEKQKLETLLQKTTDVKQKGRVQQNLEKVNAAIAKMEVTFKVLYKDHIQAIADKTKDFQKQQAKMQNVLKEAEKQHAKAVADLKVTNQKDKQQISAYQAKLEESAKQVEKIQREYEALKELQAEKEERQKQEKEQLVNVKNELTKKLEEAQRLHTKAMKVMSMSLEVPNGKSPAIPLQNKIKEWKKSVVSLSILKNKTKVEGLQNTLYAMEVLYDNLYEKSVLSRDTSHKELQEALVDMKATTKAWKAEQTNKRNALLEKLQKELGDYKEEEIDELKKINEEVLASDVFLKEISRRNAYLKSIKEIDSLMQYCKNELNNA